MRRIWNRPIGRMLLVVWLAALLLAGGPGGQRAAAERAPLDISIEAGYDGKTHTNGWLPVKFTLFNPGDDIRGELAVQLATARGGKDDLYVQPVELPKGTAKTVWMMLPAGTFNQLHNRVLFYEGTADSGKTIAFKQGDVRIQTTAVSREALQVGVVARDPDTLNFLSLLNQKGYQVFIRHMKAEELPDNPLLLSGLDMLVLNDVASDQWSEGQRAALKAWVQGGGSLFLAGGAAYPKTAAAFADISPVTYKGTESRTDLSALGSLGGKPLSLDQPFTVSAADIKDGEAVAEAEGLPLYVRKAEGLGEVWYVAYDLALSPLSSWDGNPALWERLLAGKLQPAASPGGPVNIGGFDEIDRALDYFPGLKAPHFSALLVTLMIYIVLIAPVLYLVLKKMDKREWAWVVIPVVSIVCSLAIYGIGASGRGSTLTQSLNTIEMNGNGTGVATSAVGIFVPRGGTYELEWKSRAAMMPAGGNQLQDRGDPSGPVGQVIDTQPDAPKIEYKGVPYWSISKAWVQEAAPRDTGRFEYTLGFDGGGIQGEVTNRTHQDLTDVYLLVNGQAIALGDLKAGEKKSLQSPLGNVSAPLRGDLAQIVFPYRGNPDENVHKRALLSDYLRRSAQSGKQDTPFLVGWSENELVDYTLDGKKAASDQINMWVQPVKLSFVTGGSIHIPPYAIRPQIVEGASKGVVTHPENPSAVSLINGDFTFEYRIPGIAGAHYTKLSMSWQNSAAVKLEIWNEAAQAWEPAANGMLEYDEKALAEHLISGNAIRMRAEAVQGAAEFLYPELTLEGTVR